ncbi:MAG: hypothetical protein EOM12_19185 [Verrucomicrobiae bacterium]|nr:hypothetical protein [Verrucomicrobiae bacterium]
MLEEFSMDKIFSSPRTSAYRSVLKCSDDRECLALYLAMMEASSKLLSLLHILEVAFRNRLDSEIKILAQSNALPLLRGIPPRRWYESVTYFPAGTHSDMISHKKVLKALHGATSPDDVISRLDLGYWVYLLDPRHENPSTPYHFIWQPGVLAKVFPNITGKTLSSFFKDFKKADDMRNRLCHQEPMWKDRKTVTRSHAFNNIRLKFGFLLSLLHSICEQSHRMVLETGVLGFEDPKELFSDDSLIRKYYSRIDIGKRLREGIYR